MNNKRVHFKSFTAQLTDDGNYVEGWASVFNNIDQVGDIVERGAFTKTLQARKQPVRFLWQHKMDRPIGVIEALEEQDHGLYFKARFANTPDGQMARTNLIEGVVDSFSIGYFPIQQKADKLNGRSVNRVKEVRLLEISVVTSPANEDAVLLAVKSAGGEADSLTPENLDMLGRFASFLIAEQLTAANDAGEDQIDPADAQESAVEGDGTGSAPQDAPNGETPPATASEGKAANDDEMIAKSLSDAVTALRLDAALRKLRR